MSFPIKASNFVTAFEASSQPDKTSVRESMLESEPAQFDTTRKERDFGRKPGPGGLRAVWQLFRRGRYGHVGPSPGNVVALSESVDHRAFMNCQLSRAEPDAHRIAYVGELTPRGGAAEFLSTAIAWAEATPGVPVEIVWLGEGDLLGILQAQPTPANLKQTFARIPSSNRLATMLARCGLLVIPNLTDLPFCWITEAMAAGLPVLGSTRDIQVRALVEQRETGWLFDPLRENEMFSALNAALTTTAAQLDEMRAAARARIRVLHDEPSGESVSRTIREKVTRTLADKAPA